MTNSVEIDSEFGTIEVRVVRVKLKGLRPEFADIDCVDAMRIASREWMFIDELRGLGVLAVRPGSLDVKLFKAYGYSWDDLLARVDYAFNRSLC